MEFKKIFTSQPQIENISIQRAIPRCKKYKIDIFYISTSNHCDRCKMYNKKVYSLYGWNKKYDKLPDFLFQQKCPECKCSIGATLYLNDTKQA